MTDNFEYTIQYTCNADNYIYRVVVYLKSEDDVVGTVTACQNVPETFPLRLRREEGHHAYGIVRSSKQSRLRSDQLFEFRPEYPSNFTLSISADQGRVGTVVYTCNGNYHYTYTMSKCHGRTSFVIL